MRDRYYVTTPIYFVNDVPHIGTAYTTIAADVLARYHRLRGRETFFLTGLDEHGLKIERTAKAQGKPVQAYVDAMAEPFRRTWQMLDVAYDDFIRTTEPRHEKLAQELWKIVAAKGDIELGHFEGPYCVDCEQYYTEKELVEGKLCPVHGRPAETLREPSYFFKLSRYGNKLLAHYEAHPDFVAPPSRLNEVKSFVQMGLRDLSVSRTSFRWGVPVPGDEAHVMYVWFDALANYVTALGLPGGRSDRARFWPADVHLVGKDILRFHAVYWPAFLMSAGIELPRQIFAHGWLTINGQKMSKSLRNTVDPNKLAATFGADAVRYYLMREIAFGLDGDFSHQAMIDRFNGDLANDLGNLLNRSLGLLQKLAGGLVPPAGTRTEREKSLLDATASAARDAAEAFESTSPNRALDAVWRLVAAGNEYVDKSAPWAEAKAGRADRVATILHAALEASRVLSVLVWPVMPNKSAAMRAQLGLGPLSAERGTDLWTESEPLGPGRQLAAGEPVFPRIDADRAAAILTELGALAAPAAAEPTAQIETTAKTERGPKKPAAPPPAEIPYDDFARIDLRAGRVIAAEKIAKSDKLLKLSIDLGEPQPRQVVAGIGKSYRAEDLPGKTVVVVRNLAPAKLMGVESHGMVLASGEADGLGLIVLDRPVAPGTRVK